MRPWLIALGGYSHTGKDEVGKTIIDLGYTRVAKGDLIKNAALEINPWIAPQLRLSELVESGGWEYAKTFGEVRWFLQNLPDSVVRACGRDVWNDAIFSHVRRSGLTHVVMTRICLEEEAIAVKVNGGVVWEVRRPGVGPVNDSANEHGLDDWKFDATIDNDGTLDDLSAKVFDLLA